MNPLETIIAEIAAVTPKIAPNQLTDIADHLAVARPRPSSPARAAAASWPEPSPCGSCTSA